MAGMARTTEAILYTDCATDKGYNVTGFERSQLPHDPENGAANAC